jgi:hypothetical protein
MLKFNIPVKHIVYPSEVFGYPEDESKPAGTRKDVINIL